jgi:cyclopropane-fatty-acyl-phospholipid synthase
MIRTSSDYGDVKVAREVTRAEPWLCAQETNRASRRRKEPAPFDLRSRPKANAIERRLARQLLRGFGGPPISIVLCGGEEVAVSEAAPVAKILLHDRATLWKLALRPRLEFGEAYSDGRLEVEGSLLDLLVAMYRTTAAARRHGKRPREWPSRLAHWLESNTLSGSKQHIYHHYDIGNEFYKLWLDKELVYTCAYFPTPSAGLDEAQQAKMEHVCRKLWLRPGETVVEAGCGWGALALYMARHYGVSVKAFNISREQIAHARRRADAEGLASRVEFIEDDYRNITGQYDVFVSVGMLEHVGPNHYGELARTVDRVLSPNGRGLIHSIGQNCSGTLLNAWIRRRIFPGAYPPGLREIVEFLEPWHFSVLDVENLRLHYARTLEQWLARFDAVEDRVQEMFDSRFVRMWRLYVTGSAAAFLAGGLQLFQVLFARPQWNEIPWTRAGVYQPNQSTLETCSTGRPTGR